MSSQITIKKQRLPFTQVPNELLCNPKISGLAKALWCVLYSKPDQWTFYWKEIESNFKEGRDSIRKAAKQLEDLGYIIKKQIRKNTGRGQETVYFGMEMELFFEPQNIENKELSQNTENQYTGIQNTENQHTYKDLSNKDLIYSSSSEEKKKKKLSLEEVKEEIKAHFDKNALKSDVEEFLLYHKENIHKVFEKLSYWADKWEKKFIEDVEPKRNQSESSNPICHVSEDDQKKYDRTKIIMDYCKENYLNPNSLTKEEKEEIINQQYFHKPSYPYL